MAAHLSDVEQAERLGRKRARMLPMLALIFLSQQASFFAGEDERASQLLRDVDHFKVSAWLILSLVLLLGLWSGGGWFRSKEVRALLNDEVTRAHRTSAFTLGFYVAMITAIVLYVVDMFDPVATRMTIHIVVTLGIGAALIRFGMLERQAHRLG